MSLPLKKFWSALESLPDLAGTLAEWRSLLGAEYDSLRQLLLPTKKLAHSVKSTVRGRNCIHEIRRYKDEYFTVCPDGCDAVTVPKADLIIHKLDIDKFYCQIAQSLGIEPVPAEALPYLSKAFHIGTYVPYSGFRFAVYLTAAGEPDDLQRVIDRLAGKTEPFILLAPSRSAYRQHCSDVLMSAKSCFVPLVEVLGINGRGQIALLDGQKTDDLLADFRAAHTPKPEERDGIASFPTPPGARWADVSIRFIDRHTVSVGVKGATDIYHYSKMGMANGKNAKPTKQWLLLEIFAEGHGLLDWTNRQADPKNQKRKEKLAADLRRFFHIEGDPFAIEGNGWRTLFSVALSE